ncbi:MAG: TetR family transcriptional regulator [Acidimicrobiales bacterium]
MSEGLRERKKRLTRQHISDTATGMFLERGFEEVRVTEIATECEVSEKTVYNYFPTKEALVFDNEEAMADDLRRVLGPNAVAGSPVELVVGLIADDLRQQTRHWFPQADAPLVADAPNYADVIQRFGQMIDHSPTLKAAWHEMMDRLAEVATRAMADRAGVDPDDPEPRIAANAILGLWRVQFLAMVKYSDAARSPSEMCEAVLSDVRRAARLIDTGLWSFGMAVQGRNSREQLRDAADTANEARKQVITAIKQARSAWRQAAEAHRELERKGRNRMMGTGRSL